MNLTEIYLIQLSLPEPNENVFSCNECKAILHFFYELWIKQEQKDISELMNDIICRNLTGIGNKWPLFVLPSSLDTEHLSF